MSHSVVELPLVENVKEAYVDRVKQTEKILDCYFLPMGAKVLDIGGKEYVDYCKERNYEYIMLELEKRQSNSSSYKGPEYRGKSHRHEDAVVYDGRNIPFEDEKFDLVIANFVFHHAAENTLFLLKQIKKISKGPVMVGEDLSCVTYPLSWHERNHKHQAGGLFRSDEEWQELFKIYGYNIEKQYIIRRKVTGGWNGDHSEDIYRTIYQLTV